VLIIKLKLNHILFKDLKMASTKIVVEDFEKKNPELEANYSSSMSDGHIVENTWQMWFQEVKHSFTTRDGWLGDYVSI
jgi:hypothetical protein